MTTREDIAEALAAVPELVPTLTNPDTVLAGAAWPRWVRTDFQGRLAGDAESQWDVFVALPAGYLPDTVEAGDGLTSEVADALTQVGDVTSAEPVTIGFDDQTSSPGLRFRLVTM